MPSNLAAMLDNAPSMSSPLTVMQDPRTQYPGPPKESELQSAPATQQAMSEKPDCGETSYKGHGRLAGRKALLTGADSGIGRAAAIAYLREGADIAIVYMPEEQADAEEVAQIAKDEGRKCVLIAGDIAQESFCEKLVVDAVKQLGGLDILVNNAGKMGNTKGLTDTTTQRFDSLMKTNVYSLFWITKAAAPHMKAGASIINTTSVQGYDPTPTIFDYAMTKAAIVSFTKGIAPPMMEEHGIRVNAVAPGPIWTPLQEAEGVKKKLVEFGSKTPFKRPGQPVELAPVYVLLASQEASYTTGEIYGVTGGMMSVG